MLLVEDGLTQSAVVISCGGDCAAAQNVDRPGFGQFNRLALDGSAGRSLGSDDSQLLSGSATRRGGRENLRRPASLHALQANRQGQTVGEKV